MTIIILLLLLLFIALIIIIDKKKTINDFLILSALGVFTLCVILYIVFGIIPIKEIV